MIFDENLRYKRNSSDHLDDLPLEWKIILSWIGNNKNVLEVGCHTGDFSRRLKEKGCQVTGVELNSNALEEARPFLQEAIAGDIESQTVWEILSQKKFDVILFEHVLEHLSDPWKIVEATKNLLGKNGNIIIALPNISNANTRFEIFFGRFEYEEIGVMDRTHLRFFNQKTARKMIESCGLVIKNYATPWQVNPLREFIDHLPLLTHLRFLLPEKPFRFPKFSNNITDVVMLFNCSPC